MAEIKNKQLQNALKKAGLGDIILVKDNGYFHISSDNEEMALKIAGMYSNSISVNNFNDLTIDEWVEEIKCLLEKDKNNFDMAKKNDFEVLTSKSVFDADDLEQFYAEQENKLNDLGYDLSIRYKIQFDGKNYVENLYIEDAIQRLNIKDGAELVRFSNGKIGYVGCANGDYKDCFVIIDKAEDNEFSLNGKNKMATKKELKEFYFPKEDNSLKEALKVYVYDKNGNVIDIIVGKINPTHIHTLVAVSYPNATYKVGAFLKNVDEVIDALKEQKAIREKNKKGNYLSKGTDFSMTNEEMRDTDYYDKHNITHKENSKMAEDVMLELFNVEEKDDRDIVYRLKRDIFFTKKSIDKAMAKFGYSFVEEKETMRYDHLFIYENDKFTANVFVEDKEIFEKGKRLVYLTFGIDGTINFYPKNNLSLIEDAEKCEEKVFGKCGILMF